MAKEPIKKAFRPRARLLSLLGEQLIDNARLAVFELVKNSYDADANSVTVRLKDPDDTSGSITVTDDGSGMTPDILTGVWLEPGADFRSLQKEARARSPRFGRLPLGEKGVGRFASHKLGENIALWTRAAGESELHVRINWSEQIERRYMDETEISIWETDGEHFKPGETGTRIEITDLKTPWTRGEVRRLWRNVTSISSPFATVDDFDVSLKAPDRKQWLDGLLDVADILQSAIWRYEFRFHGDGFDWEYEFRPPSGMKVKGASAKGKGEPLALSRRLAEEFFYGQRPLPRTVPPEFTQGVGPVSGTFFVFDQDKIIAPFVREARQVNDFLEENGGIRVYRDDIRVYSYGEPGDDWLGLDLRRVNEPTKAISNNNIVGLVSLDMEKSTELHEKTSRDGFDRNDAFHRLRAIVLSALGQLEARRTVDKARMRRVVGNVAKESRISPDHALAQLRQEVERRRLGPEIGKLVDKVGTRVREMQETFLRPGASQMHVATLFHEVDHGVRALYSAIRKGEPIDRLEQRSHALIELLDSFSTFFRKSPEALLKMSDVVRLVCQLNADRFERHRIILSTPILTGEAPDFTIRAPRNIVMGAITNMIDNSIYWLDQKWPGDSPKKRRAIIVTTSRDFAEGPALLVADNGPGYQLAPEDVMQPFITLKADGMGIGMYYTRLVMEACGGHIAFPSRDDVDLPRSYDGARTALVFGRGEWAS